MRPLSRSKLRRLSVAAAATAIIAAASAATVLSDHPRVAHAAAAPMPEVPVASVEVRDVAEAREYTGHLAAAKTAEVRARVPGFIQSVHFTEGSTVSAGQLLFQLDARPYAAVRERSQAELDEARARLALAKADHARSRSLFAEGAVPAQELDARSASESGLTARERAARAMLASTSLELSFSRVTAPFAGRIGRALVTEGNVVAGGAASAPLATLVSIDPIHVMFDVDEPTYLSAVRGMRNGTAPMIANVGLEAESGFPRDATIDFVDNRIESGTVRVRALLANADGSLSPGSFARVRLPVAAAAPTILIDDAAIGSDQGKRYVLVVGQDGTTEYRAVELGAMAHGLRIIKKGLAAGESIVVRGLVRPGMKVAPRRVPMANKSAVEGG